MIEVSRAFNADLEPGQSCAWCYRVVSTTHWPDLARSIEIVTGRGAVSKTIVHKRCLDRYLISLTRDRLIS